MGNQPPPRTVAAEKLVSQFDVNGDGGMLATDWVKELAMTPGVRPVLTAEALSCESTDLSPDHMFAAFLRAGMVHDLLSLYNDDARRLYSVLSLGDNVCGHPKTVHGGMTSAIIDETLGVLNYILKRDRVVPHGPSYTVHLEVDYKIPVPAGTTVVCVAELDKVEGRKCWVRAEVKNRPDGDVYAAGKALFVIPKTWQPPEEELPASSPRAIETESEVERVAQRRASMELP